MWMQKVDLRFCICLPFFLVGSRFEIYRI